MAEVEPPPLPFRLYAVADASVTAAPDFAERVSRLGELAGRRLGLYVRDDAAEVAAKAIAALAPYGTPVFVRRAALAAGGGDGAAGVHLTADDLREPGIVRRVRRADAALLVAASIHDASQAVRARDAACAFAMFGHVFATPSKQGLPPRGTAALAAACTAADPMPVLAVGGVTPAHVEACLGAGARGVAAVRGLFAHPDPRPMLESYLDALG